MFDFAAAFESGLTYNDFLQKYGEPSHLQRWQEVHERITLTAAQKTLLESFTRELRVLCLAGTWCGDCVNQCPIFDHFAQANDRIQVRFFDRDDSPQLAEAVRLCGGARVPVVVFLNEDGQFCGLYGDRTLSKYRQMANDQLGPSCPTGLGMEQPLLNNVVQDWLNEFERMHLMVRLSPRLRQKHGD